VSDRPPLRPTRGWRVLIVVVVAVVSLPLLPFVLFATGIFAVPLVLAALAVGVRYITGPITSVLPKND
jgi:hypothetical protein